MENHAVSQACKWYSESHNKLINLPEEQAQRIHLVLAELYCKQGNFAVARQFLSKMMASKALKDSDLKHKVEGRLAEIKILMQQQEILTQTEE